MLLLRNRSFYLCYQRWAEVFKPAFRRAPNLLRPRLSSFVCSVFLGVSLWTPLFCLSLGSPESSVRQDMLVFYHGVQSQGAGVREVGGEGVPLPGAVCALWALGKGCRLCETSRSGL